MMKKIISEKKICQFNNNIYDANISFDPRPENSFEMENEN